MGVFSESEAEAARQLLSGFDFILVTILDRGTPRPSKITELSTKASVSVDEPELESMPDIVIARCRWLVEDSGGSIGSDTRIEVLLNGVWCELPWKSGKLFICIGGPNLFFGEERNAPADSVIYAYDFPPGDYRILIPIAEAIRDENNQVTDSEYDWYAAEFKITG